VFRWGLDWEKLEAKEVEPPFKPTVNGVADTGLIDPEFLREEVRRPPSPGLCRTLARRSMMGSRYCSFLGLCVLVVKPQAAISPTPREGVLVDQEAFGGFTYDQNSGEALGGGQ